MAIVRTPRFFTVILPHTLESATLELPASFVNNHGSFLAPHHVRLELPTGARWRVAVEKHGDRAWLRNGWGDFVERCNVEVGCFLVFEYRQGDELFHVRVFQRSAVEIEYPTAGTVDRALEITDVDDDDEDKSSEGFGEDGASLGVLDKCNNLPSGTKDNVLAKVEAFKSEKPSFTIHVRRSYTSANGDTHVPLAYSRRYLKEFKGGEKMLHFHGENRKKWVISYRIVNSNTKWGFGSMRLRRGWMEFLSDNDLRVGDACIFEMIPGNVKEYKVTIFKRVDFV